MEISILWGHQSGPFPANSCPLKSPQRLILHSQAQRLGLPKKVQILCTVNNPIHYSGAQFTCQGSSRATTLTYLLSCHHPVMNSQPFICPDLSPATCSSPCLKIQVLPPEPANACSSQDLALSVTSSVQQVSWKFWATGTAHSAVNTLPQHTAVCVRPDSGTCASPDGVTLRGSKPLCSRLFLQVLHSGM